ncbi:MAG: AI-2E family transporter [Ilumatobacteraceae bacterium]
MSGEEGDAVVVTPWRAVVAVVSVLGLIVLARFGSRLVDVAGVVTTAVALAFLLAPLRSRLARHVGQSASLVITALATAVGVIVAGTVVLNDLRHQTAAVADLLVARIERLPSGSFLGRTVDALGIETSLTSWLESLPSNFVAGADTSTALGQQFVDLAVVVILATFLLANATSMFDAVVRWWPRPERAGVRQMWADSERSGAGYVRRCLVLAIALGLAVAAVADVSGLPAPISLGAWAGAWFVVPMVGLPAGMLPIVGVALVADGRIGPTVAVASSFVIGVIGIAVRRRLVDRRTHALGASAHAGAIAIGFARRPGRDRCASSSCRWPSRPYVARRRVAGLVGESPRVRSSSSVRSGSLRLAGGDHRRGRHAARRWSGRCSPEQGASSSGCSSGRSWRSPCPDRPLRSNVGLGSTTPTPRWWSPWPSVP